LIGLWLAKGELATTPWPLDLFLNYSDAGIMTMQTVTHFPSGDDRVAFHRTELAVILGLYGRMVAAGEWRDYGISALKDVAVFSVFRRTAEHPLYRIEKRPKLRGKQGQYCVIGMEGQILKRGNDLKQVLTVLERKLIRIVD
jgi:hypothetical protein